MKPLLMALLLLVTTITVQAQTVTISGRVTDDAGVPIAFATIMEAGTKNGVKTDTAGWFTIKLANSNHQLLVSSAGFDSQKIIVQPGKAVTVSLSTAKQLLQEVVVVGYGAAQKRQLVGASQSLQGRVAGISINNWRTNNGNEDFNTEEYDAVAETGFRKVTDHPLSTFSIDVDAASYSNVRRILNGGSLPDAGAVRIEEMINYFKYDYLPPQSDKPFSIYTEAAVCPWNKAHKLVSIGLQGKRIPTENLPASNLVFLIDVSGSMNVENKLPLVQASLKLLVDQLRPQDHIAIVVYAGAAGVVLPPTSGTDAMKIKTAIDNLHAGGSTAGGEGIRLAYKIAKDNFLKEGNNRIILCTDGDFNVGVSSNSEMEKLVETERESGVFLTVLGYGMGNYKDSKMQVLADKGNGNHAYIDSENEAKKVLVNEFGGTLFTIAKDVKLQVEFNPNVVQAYRLIGYENRMLNKEDFNDDKKDAGDMGSGHTVTALYEIIPAGVKSDFIKEVDPLKYQVESSPYEGAGADEMVTIKFRYKDPGSKKSKLIEAVVPNEESPFEQTTENFRFAVAVAEFGMLLRNSEFKSASAYSHVIKTATTALSNDRDGYRKEFIELVGKAEKLSASKKDTSKN